MHEDKDIYLWYLKLEIENTIMFNSEIGKLSSVWSVNDGFPAGFWRVSGEFPAGFRQVSDEFSAGFRLVSG